VSPLVTDVGKKALIALRWSAAARLAGQALSWVITIVVIRLLSPADYGLVAMSVILPTTLYLINDLGLDVVLVQNQSPDTAFVRQVFGVVIVINLLCALLLLLGGCGAQDSRGQTASPAATPTPTAAPTPSRTTPVAICMAASNPREMARLPELSGTKSTSLGFTTTSAI